MTIISACSLSYSLECFQVQGLKCCYQMNRSLKHLHFLIIPKCLWSLDSSIYLFIGIISFNLHQKDPLCFAQDFPERLVLFLCCLLLNQHSNSPCPWEKERQWSVFMYKSPPACPTFNQSTSKWKESNCEITFFAKNTCTFKKHLPSRKNYCVQKDNNDVMERGCFWSFYNIILRYNERLKVSMTIM